MNCVICLDECETKTPCACKGSVGYVHPECIEPFGACATCKAKIPMEWWPEPIRTRKERRLVWKQYAQYACIIAVAWMITVLALDDSHPDEPSMQLRISRFILGYILEVGSFILSYHCTLGVARALGL
jgi:hypothetical protein